MRRYKTENLYNSALLSEAQQKDILLTIDDDGTDYAQFNQIKQVMENITNFVQNGQNLYLHSHTCGNGKTSCAIKLLKAYLDKIWARSAPECRGLFISVPRFLIALKNQIDNYDEYAEYIQAHIEKADLVVWDDIAAKTGTDYEINRLLSFIDTRISLGKSNIFTSNLSSKEIYRALGDRLGSRICNLSIEVELNGKDKRHLKRGV